MRMHKFYINESERNTKADVYHHMRRFLHVYKDEDTEVFSGHIETIVKKPEASFSVRFHVGNAGSETPLDGHLTVFGTGLYWGISAGRKLAQKLTSSPRHKYDSRDISVRVFEGRMCVNLWTPPDRWSRGEFPRWRSGSFALNPLDILFGPLRYSYEDLAETEMVLSIPGDEETYAVKVKLQRCSFGRKKSQRKIISYYADVDTRQGIPDHYDSSGGWKGDRVYAFGVEIKNHRSGWDIDAKNLIIARILKDRGMSGFREAQPRD